MQNPHTKYPCLNSCSKILIPLMVLLINPVLKYTEKFSLKSDPCLPLRTVLPHTGGSNPNLIFIASITPFLIWSLVLVSSLTPIESQFNLPEDFYYKSKDFLTHLSLSLSSPLRYRIYCGHERSWTELLYIPSKILLVYLHIY